MSKKAVLYARVSGDDRKLATSGIESQLHECRSYAESKDYEVVIEFREEPDKQTSGADWLPELENMMQYANQHGFDVLIVREIDRLARNRFKQMSVENELSSLNISVEYVKGQYEDSAEGRLLKGLMAEFAEFEREKIKDRTVRGIEQSIASGNVKLGGCAAPFGYDVKNVNGRRTLAINEYEADIVRLIFDMYVNKYVSLQKIATYLDENNIQKPHKGKAQAANVLKDRVLGWSIGTLDGMLKNETYVGRWYYRKTRAVKNPKTGKRKHVPRPRDEWILVEIPPIINESVFEKVKARKEKNKRQLGKRKTYFYPMTGMIRCGKCGCSIQGFTTIQGGIKYTYYRCAARADKKGYKIYCDLSYFRAEQVEMTIWNWIKTILLDTNRLFEAFDQYEEDMLSTFAPTLRMMEANEKRMTELEEQKERLKMAYRNNVIDLDEFATDRMAIDKEIVTIQGSGRA